MVFYRNGTLPETCLPDWGCADWINEFPQGFSCGVGIHKEGCFFDQYEFVDCSEVAVKVASRCCDHGEIADDCFAFPVTGFISDPCTEG